MVWENFPADRKHVNVPGTTLGQSRYFRIGESERHSLESGGPGVQLVLRVLGRGCRMCPGFLIANRMECPVLISLGHCEVSGQVAPPLAFHSGQPDGVCNPEITQLYLFLCIYCYIYSSHQPVSTTEGIFNIQWPFFQLKWENLLNFSQIH